MLKKSLQLGIVLFFIGSSSFAQQWNGNNNATDVITRDGSVGIGTTPSAKLDVNFYNPTGGIPQAGLLLKTNSFNDGPTAISSYFLKAVDLGNGFVPFILKGDGLVGIGTGAPESRLHIDITNSSITTPQYGLLLKTGSFFTGENAANSYYLKAMDGGSQSTAFIVKGNGSVGIGTENLGSFKLAVDGKIGAREVQVTLSNPFPDYVFDSKYKLRSLSSLENYINENKHLPNIPSAAEVEKKGGVELGQLNTKLLEKVEELTLYIIEINKKVEKLEKENEALKKGK